LRLRKRRSHRPPSALLQFTAGAIRSFAALGVPAHGRDRDAAHSALKTMTAAAVATPTPLPTLSAVDLSCRRGNRVLFKGINLHVRPGEVTWLRGRNGCGKTTLLRVAAGLSPPEAGRMLWDETPVRRSERFRRERVYIGHSNALKDDLSVTESLQFLARLHDRPSDEPALRAAMHRVGIDHRRGALVRTLSQGQRRRAALARLALERQPTLWILDEPYDALDSDGVACVNAMLGEHLGRGGSVLLTSHLSPGDGAPPMVEYNLDAAA
jgi:heme exporter protein A